MKIKSNLKIQWLWLFFIAVFLGSYANAGSLNALTKLNFISKKKSVEFDLEFSNKINRNQVYSFVTEKPARVIVDLVGVQNQLGRTRQTIAENFIRDVDIIQAQGRSRLIINLNQPVKENIKINENNLTLSLKSSTGKQDDKEYFSAVGQSDIKRKHIVENVSYRPGQDGSGKIIVKVSDPSMGINLRQKDDNLVINFEETKIAKNVKQEIDLAMSDTTVTGIQTYQQGGNAIITANLKGKVKHLAYQVNDEFIINIKPDTGVGTPDSNTQGEPIYQGNTISLNFQNIKVRSVLQLLAEFTGSNIVVSDSVTGDITLRLNNVHWQEALNIIMRTQGLAKRQYGRILLIAPATEIAAYERQELQAKREKQALEPLESQLIQLQFAKAKEVEKLLKDKENTLLSSRGHVSVDIRTNTLWIQETRGKIAEVRSLITKLDIPVKQVLIESRIVNVDESLEQELGIRFGITAPNYLSGTISGANSVRLLEPGDNVASVLPISERLNFDLPSVALAGTQPSSIALALAKLGRGVLLDLELSALESEQGVEVISSPRLITANQQEARIDVGEEIPFEVATSSGATAIEFKKATLTLQVTPQITPDHRVILTLQVNQNKRGDDTPAGPAIDTREVKTQVLVNNGQTIVLGGLFEKNKQNITQRVPFLGNLPVIGAFFRHKTKKDIRTELLIFITPKIISESGDVQINNYAKVSLK